MQAQFWVVQRSDKAVGPHKSFPMAFSGGKCLKRLFLSEYVSGEWMSTKVRKGCQIHLNWSFG